MIRRDYTADFINSVINDPSVKDGAEVKDIADVTSLVENLNNFVLVTEFGGFVVIKKMAGIYECHTQFLPAGRGKHAVDAVNESLRYMFLRTDCIRIVTKVHVENKAVQHFTAQFFRKRGQNGDHFYYSLDFDDWVAKDADCQMAGEQFHKLIAGKQNHDEDSLHDCYVGAAWLMAQKGNVYKGQLHYNRWAVMSGYELLIVLSEAPLIVSVGEMKLEIDQERITCL